jgi:prepilin-type N-terminal cleavage/methylation domain-containing protein
MSNRPRQSLGFTLIELSIVLVIIGLIIGGVLVGQDLISAATLRSIVKQQEQFKTAVATFKTKYDCLPGDCTAATSLGFTTNGDGNGILGDATGYLFAGLNSEQLSFWQHLYQANLISNDGISAGGGGYVPANIRTDTWWVGYSAHAQVGGPGYPVGDGPLGNILAIVGIPGQCGFITCGGARFSEGLTPYEAYQLDSKVDDGMPLTGNVKAAMSANYIDDWPISIEWQSTPNLCVNGLETILNVTYAPSATNNNTRCNLLFKLGF